ncbi:protein LYK5-like [Coffea eugenioides]|uniref:protein LYK5-like n=1 Tax=Coffea eugenioides TaxID=49369 RepID=UPI000F6110F4|nr:protein LYK5-like [Coffea eugenioides]
MATNFNTLTTLPNSPPMAFAKNNSVTFLSSDNACLDFFFHVVPNTPLESLTQRHQPAWDFDPLATLKLICNLRGVRGTGMMAALNNGDGGEFLNCGAASTTVAAVTAKGKQKKKCLDWKQRLQIGLDVAMGLNYLHSYTSPPHVHKNLKSSNVLVDADFRAKISNFGPARSADGQGGQFALTRHIIGTKGYMAPEYLENGLVSTMLDVYSFGVLLLEIFIGKEVAVLYEAVNVNLAEILSPVLDEKDGIENLSQIMDSSLEGNYPSELAILLIRLIASCLKKHPSARPTMHEIVQTLSTSVTATTSWHSKESA